MVFRFRVRRNWRVTAREGKGEINLGQVVEKIELPSSKFEVKRRPRASRFRECFRKRSSVLSILVIYVSPPRWNCVTMEIKERKNTREERALKLVYLDFEETLLYFVNYTERI